MKAHIAILRPTSIRSEVWCGYTIRFVEYDGEWYAILKDICDALDLKTFHVMERLTPNMTKKMRINVCDLGSEDVTSRARHAQDMTVVNEVGIYEALFSSRKAEAVKFRTWSAGVIKKMRKTVGLESYQALRMTDPEIQARIDDILDTLYWDDEKKCLMRSVTVPGGDVEQVPFE